MNRLLAFLVVAALGTRCLISTAYGYRQGGGFGGGQAQFAGAQGGGFGGQNGRNTQVNSAIQGIDQAISGYLSGEEIKSVLTPGEFCEWTLQLKAGQVVIAEARSDAFDPALEVVDSNGKVLGANDDRYPGDQRPLLFWRCSSAGNYALHARCFHDKSGGQFFVRFRVYDCIDVPPGKNVVSSVDSNSPFLLRIPMESGEIKEIISHFGGARNAVGFRIQQIIAPNGLPDINLSHQIPSITNNTLILAPVSGDYFALANLAGPFSPEGQIHVFTRDLVPQKLIKEGTTLSGKAQTNLPALWQLSVKAGDLLEVNTPDLFPNCQLQLAEVPDISKYDLAKPETNPFFPKVAMDPGSGGLPLSQLPGRARDSRVYVFHAWRDAKLWIASNGWGPGNEYSVAIKPAAKAFSDVGLNHSKLGIGKTDYWAFEAKAGDVMTLESKSDGFAPLTIGRDPDMTELRHAEARVDQASDGWRMIVQRPGTYVVSMACQGDGGSGDYSFSRKVFHAKEFGLDKPAKDEITKGQVQIWQFTATPKTPVYIHWTSSDWQYEISIIDSQGRQTDFQRQAVDAHNTFGILKVDRPMSYVIVLTGTGGPAKYSIELSPLPGYK